MQSTAALANEITQPSDITAAVIQSDTSGTQSSGTISSTDLGSSVNSEPSAIPSSDSTNISDISIGIDGGQIAPLAAGDSKGDYYDGFRQPSKNKLAITRDPVSGGFVYSYPLSIPPGRNGMQPDLKLQYNSHTNELNNAFGYGWEINIPYIERINRWGVDNLYSAYLFFSSVDGELATTSTSTSSYAAKTDNGEFLKYAFDDSKWIVTDKKGTQYIYGSSTDARLDNPASSTQIFKWMLEKVVDTNGNHVKFEYYKDNGMIYPSSIKYTGSGDNDGIFQIDFNRSARSDTATSTATGFYLKSRYKVDEIDVKIDGNLAERYSLDFATGDNTSRLLLNSITRAGYDESGATSTLPATTLVYQSQGGNKNWGSNNGYAIPVPFTDRKYDPGVRFADVNGDGLVDIIKSSYENYIGNIKQVYINQGDGTGWALDSNYSIPIIFTYNFVEYGTFIADVNGDGFSDLIQSYTPCCGGATLQGVYINNANGTGWTLNSNYSIPVIFKVYRDNKGVRMADVNGDGLSDIIQGYYNVGYRVFINKGDGTGWALDSSYSVPIDLDVNGADVGVWIDDANGDGLPDLIRSYTNCSSQSYQGVYINKGDGTGWALDSNYSIPIIFKVCSIEKGARQADINGDGLVDMIQSYDDNYGHYYSSVYINKGNGTGWAVDSSYTLPGPYFVVNGSVDNGMRIMDVDGDGMSDIVRSYKDLYGVISTSTSIKNGDISDLAANIETTEGASMSVSYKNSPQYADNNGLLNPALPLVLTTANSVAIDDGMGNVSTTTYSYSGGAYYYNNPYDRKFAGFASTTETDPYGNVTVNYYHQGNTTSSSTGEYDDHISKIGKSYRIETYDDSGNLYSKTINKWERYDQGDGRNFVKLTQTIESSYDGDTSHKDKAQTFSYDDQNGNKIQGTNWGEVTGSDDGSFTDTGSDMASTTISYAASSTAYIVGLPSQEITYDQNANKAKETKYYYDSLSLGNVGKGNRTKEEMWKDGSNYINTQKAYNDFGLVTQSTDPRGKATDFVYDAYNLYVATTTNPLDQDTQYYYDYSIGKPKKTIDPNGSVFETIFDGLNRVVEEKQPDVNTPSNLVTKTAYVYADTGMPRSVRRTDYLNNATSTDTYTYLDGLDRTIQQRKSSGNPGTFSVTDYSYDKNGLMSKESLPYFSSGASSTAATTTDVLYSVYGYDPLHRLVSAANAVGTTTYAYSDWKTTITDPLDNDKGLYKDAYDNLVRVDEHNGASTYSTYYTYNLLAKLTRITDASGNIRNFTYDGLGRQQTSEDLHGPSDGTFGTRSFSYDNSGNLTSKTDAKSQTTTYTYDDINRPLTEDYTGQSGTEVLYGYDTCNYGIGRLCSATTSVSAVSYSYNPLGQTAMEDKTIGGTVYSTEYGYDRQGNQIMIVYPDDAQAEFVYNSGGLIDRVSRKESTDQAFSTVADYTYSPNGQPATISYSNGIVTTNTYDPSELYRLSAKETSLGATSSAQSLAYAYDSVGNITRIIDSSDTNAAKTIDYVYDDLYRILSASTTAAVNNEDYLETYSYDAIGNMLSKSDLGDYSYTDNGYNNPHAVTGIASSTYAYDNNGNLTSDGLWTHSWDYRNRLIQSTDGTTTIGYAYDDQDNRISYSDGTATTTTVNKYYQTSGATSTKYIYANGQLVATIEGADVYYNHNDHLSGSNVITDASGSVAELLDYLPYGSLRIDEKSGSFEERKKYTGHEYDAETGLNYMAARYQNPSIGKFISVDPAIIVPDKDLLVKPQELNSYSYVANNPLKHIDPTGEKVELITRGISSNLRNTFSSFNGKLSGLGGALDKMVSVANHSFLRITPDNPNDFKGDLSKTFTLGGHMENGNLVGLINYSTDVNTQDSSIKSMAEISTPTGITDTQFINNILEVNNRMNSSDVKYNLLSINALGRNCNNLSSTLIEGAGGMMPNDFSPRGLDYGLKESVPSVANPNHQSSWQEFKSFTSNAFRSITSKLK